MSVPEIIVVNKADEADPVVVAAILANEPHAVVVSARTGEGIDELLAAIESQLPVPAVEVDVVVPYSRGDLINQLHLHGEIDSLEHQGDGTHVVAKVHPDLAADLAEFRR